MIRRGLAPSLATAVALALALLSLPARAIAQTTIDLGEVFEASEDEPLSARQILDRARDNLYGFDASISALARSASSGQVESEFLMLRRRTQGATRWLVVSLQPRDVRGTRVLELHFDDGREENYAFVPSVGSGPMRTQFRLAEPFLGTWHEITGSNSELQTLSQISPYEIVSLEQGESQGEPAYRLEVRPLIDRGFEREELWIARSDFAILEKRQYLARRTEPSLIYRAPRAQMTRVENRTLPGQVVYLAPSENRETIVQLEHGPAPEGEEGLFFPRGFHLIPIPGLN